MAYNNVKTILRVDCSPIADTRFVSERIRLDEDFQEMFSDFDSFRIGDTTNYRNGGLEYMRPDEMVYRYEKSYGGIQYVFDITSRFFYIRMNGNNLPVDLNPYYRMMETITNTIGDVDKYVIIKEYAIGKDFEERLAGANTSELIESKQDSFMFKPENVKIVFQSIDKSDIRRKMIAALVSNVNRKPSVDKPMFDTAFNNALRKAEEKYGLR